jgi:hypothetical protein
MAKTRRMNKTTVTLSNGESFTIIHDLPMRGVVDSFESALDNWKVRTKTLTAESLVDYINKQSKINRQRFLAITETKFKELNSHQTEKITE